MNAVLVAVGHVALHCHAALVAELRNPWQTVESAHEQSAFNSRGKPAFQVVAIGTWVRNGLQTQVRVSGWSQ